MDYVHFITRNPHLFLYLKVSKSFIVSDAEQVGDVIGFIKKIENIDFKDAVEILAEKTHITLPQIETSEEDKKKMLLQEKVLKVNESAAIFFHENLYKPTAKSAQEYVKKRRLDNNTLKNFQIGCSGNYDELYKELRKQGCSDKEILESKLVMISKNGAPIDNVSNKRYQKQSNCIWRKSN